MKFKILPNKNSIIRFFFDPLSTFRKKKSSLDFKALLVVLELHQIITHLSAVGLLRLESLFFNGTLVPELLTAPYQRYAELSSLIIVKTKKYISRC